MEATCSPGAWKESRGPSTEDPSSDGDALVQSMFYQLYVFQVIFDNADEVAEPFLLLLQMLEGRKEGREQREEEVKRGRHTSRLLICTLSSLFLTKSIALICKVAAADIQMCQFSPPPPLI